MIILYTALCSIIAWYVLPYLVRKAQVRWLRRYCRQRRLIALTYDDGPSRGVTMKLIQLLGQYGAQATFFVLGNKIDATWEVAKLVVNAGHEIGSHSYRHLNAWKRSPLPVYRDIETGLRKTREVATCTLFRPPHGKGTLATMVQVVVNRCRHAWWTIDSSDTWHTPLPAGQVIERIRKEGGGVILMHDHDRPNHPEREAYVLDLTRGILELARVEGFRICKMSETISA